MAVLLNNVPLKRGDRPSGHKIDHFQLSKQMASADMKKFPGEFSNPASLLQSPPASS
ncbi:hypothetical protein SK128_022309, partial [Halocaridina rubra]